MKTFRYTHAVVAGLVLSFVLSGCQTMEEVGKVGTAVGVATGKISREEAESIQRGTRAVAKTFEDITPEQEYYIGRAVAATLLGDYKPIEDRELTLYVNVIGQAMAAASEKPETFGGYHFLVLESDQVNAFAAPGGLILLTRGMLQCCRNEAALAAVLAHEVAHVENEHGLKAIKKGRLTSALTILAVEGAKQFGGQELAELTAAFEGSIQDITATLVNNGYSRAFEREADQSAVRIMQRVGYDPTALIEMLAVMDQRLKPGGPDFAKTHPDPADRIEEIRQWIGAETLPAPPPPERQKRFLEAMGPVLRSEPVAKAPLPPKPR